MLIIGLVILAAPVLSVYMDKAGTAMFFYSGKAHGDKDRKNRIVRCVLSMMIFGMISLTGYMNGCAMSKQERLAEELDGQQPGGIEGKVYEIRQSGDEWRVYVYAEWITFGGGDSEETVEYRGRSKVLLYMEDVGSLKTGMKLTLSCSLSRPDSADNPGEFDAREYYSHKGIYIVGKDISILECGEDYSRIGDILFRLRIKSGEITDSVFGETDGSVIKAMLLGDKSGIDRDTKKLFQMNGIAHILAISGVKTLKLDIPLVPEPRINWAFVPLHIAIIYILKLCLDEEIIPRCRFPCSRGYLIKCINWQKKQSFSVRLILWQKSKNWQKEKMNMAYKKYREMKVYEASGYQYKRTPSIVLKGKWLSDLGFDIGEQIEVKCEDGRLVITKANEIWMTE